jgi:hypothetical protein
MPSTPSSVAEAFRTTLDLFETGLDLMRQNLRRSHPEAGDEDIELASRVATGPPGSGVWRLFWPPLDVNTRLA